MKPAQWILVPLLLALLLTLRPRLRQASARGALSLVLLAALVFTLFQDSSIWLARQLGIGRGVDLVIYFSLLGLGVVCVLLYLRINELERLLVELVRARALERAEEQKKAE